MKLWFNIIVLTCFTQVEGSIFECPSFWPFTVLGFCPIHTRVVTKVEDAKNTTDIGPKEQTSENATSTTISTVNTTESTTTEGTTSSSSTTTTNLPKDTTIPASSTTTTETITETPILTTQGSTTTTQETDETKDEITSGKSGTSETPETSKDEISSDTEDESPATNDEMTPVKANPSKKIAASTVEPIDSDNDDSDDQLATGATDETEEVSDKSEKEDGSKVFYEETIPAKSASPTKVPRKTTDMADVKKTLKTNNTPTTSKLTSRSKGLPSQLKPARQQLAKSNAAAKVSSAASNSATDDSLVNGYYGSSLLGDNE